MTEIVREVQIENTSLIINVPKDNGGDIKAGVRYALNSPKHGDVYDRLFYVDSDYDIKVIPRDEFLEVIATNLDFSIRLHKNISYDNIDSAIKNILYRSDNLICVGNYNIREHYLIEAKQNEDQ